MMCCQNAENQRKLSSPGIQTMPFRPDACAYLNIKQKEREGDLERHEMTSL